MNSIIKANNIDIEFPIYTSSQRSFKKILLGRTVGGGVNRRVNSVSIKALSNVSFEINVGDRVALIGHNGAGKTTLLRALAGVYTPTAGSLIVNGNVVSLIDMSMGMDSEATGYQNIYIRGIILGMSLKEISKHIDYIVGFSELGEYIGLPVRTYSSGMLLRLAFSIISVLKPDVLLMDEWLTVGDASFRDKMGKKLATMVDNSSVMILASHSRGIVEKYCNKYFLLSSGNIVEIESSDLSRYLD